MGENRMLNVIFIKKKRILFRWGLIFGMKKGDFLPVNATLFYRKLIKI